MTRSGGTGTGGTGRASPLAGLAARVTPAMVLAMALAVTPAAAGAAGAGGVASPADGWDRLWGHVIADITIIGVVFGAAAAYLLWRYRAKRPDAVGCGPALSVAQALGLALVPAAVFLADGLFLAADGWAVFNTQRTVPAGALEIQLTANQFYWEFDYGGGVTNESDDTGRPIIKVPVGKPVVLRMTSSDVIHSFFIPEFRIKEEVVPGRKSFLWFIAEKPERHILATCAEFCGFGHPQMPAFIDAVPQEDFDAWYASQAKHAGGAPAAQAPNS